MARLSFLGNLWISRLPDVGHSEATRERTDPQLILAEEDHALFTGQPISDGEAGGVPFAQRVPHVMVRKASRQPAIRAIIGTEGYPSTHDDAATLDDIGAGSHSDMIAVLADGYGGALTRKEILNLTVPVLWWGPATLEMLTQESPREGGDCLRPCGYRRQSVHHRRTECIIW